MDGIGAASLKLNRESPLERDHVVGRFTDAEEKLFEVANEILMYRSHK